MDNVYTEIVQGRLKEDKETYTFFLDVQKAYDIVWRDGLCLKLWDMGVKGKMWRVIKKMYEASSIFRGRGVSCVYAFFLDVQKAYVKPSSKNQSLSTLREN